MVERKVSSKNDDSVEKSLLAAKQASIDERHDVIINIFCLAAFFPDLLLVTSSWLEMKSVGF